MTELLQEHSPLGGSGAYRWMPCPGSVGLSEGIDDPESEDAVLGTAAHDLGAYCLKENTDAWEYIGQCMTPDLPDYDIEEGDSHWVTKDMADAVQVYLNAVRSEHPDRNQGNSYIEREFYCPDLYEYFWGQSDFGYWDEPGRHLHVWDYKHGVGVVVEVAWNAQLMYYACGMLEHMRLWDEVDQVTLWVAQPRGHHHDGPIRSWTIDALKLEWWLGNQLLPAMGKAMTSRETASGPHCRFCPARARACPQMLKDLKETEDMVTEFKLTEKDAARELTNDEVARFLDLQDVMKIAGKAAGQTAFARLEGGHRVPNRKLVGKSSNRKWRDDAEAALKKKFGKRAFTSPELKSPAKIEELPLGEKMTARYAFKPDAGLVLARGDDSRAAVGQATKSMSE
ncbi:hypothetical protein LCGC14_2732010, partial [marine sediment metagenome]